MKTLSSFALKALSGVVVSGQTVRIVDTLDRKLYLEVNDALEALGGKWSRKLKSHVFDGKSQEDISDALEQVMLTGGFVDKKQELGQFFTPAKIADRLVALANFGAGLSSMRVLEPSAGRGALIEAIRRIGARCSISAFELDHENAEALKRNANALPYLAVLQANFLAMPPEAYSPFDRVVMNPPFARGADVDHVLHAWKFLKPGGRLVSVMSSGVTFRQDKRSAEFRAFVKRNSPAEIGGPRLFEELPEGSFAASGTNVNTVIVVLEKAP